MSELVQYSTGRSDLILHFLGTTSALALSVFLSVGAFADESADRPTVWIDLGGQLERLDSKQTILAPTFFDNTPPSALAPLIDSQRPSRYSIGGEGRLTLAPEGSDWTFSVSVRYGRSNAGRHNHYQSAHTTTQTLFGRQVTEQGRPLHIMGDGQASAHESHLLLDFMAGKDVGLGLFGDRSHSVISAGVRFAQFTSASHVSLHARPEYRSGPFVTKYTPTKIHLHGAYFHNYTASLESQRNTHAIGPSVSWDASLPIAGNRSGMEASFDWGLNAAILFGRQRAKVHHQTTGAYLYDYPGGYYPSKRSGYAKHPLDQSRSHAVVVPNVGGFAGVTFQYLNAKVSFGYRADFFFGAVDKGIDARQSETIGLYGPFAKISVGLGG